MPYTMRIVIIIAVFIVSTFLFYCAAGTLNPTKMNLISISYYCYVLLAYLGSALVFLGYREHYLMAKIRILFVYEWGFFYVAMVGILFPLTICFCNALFRPLFGADSYENYLKKPFEDTAQGDHLTYFLFLVAFVMCAGVTALFYFRARQIPLLPWFTGGATRELRQILGRSTYINGYLKTFFMLQFPAYFSFFVYIRMRQTGNLLWTLLFAAYFLLAIITKTYDFEKAPVMIYLLLFVIIETFFHRLRFVTGLVVLLGVIGMMLGMYVFVFGYQGSLFNLYTGPFSRLIFSQIAGFFHTLDIFPARHAFLQGESLPSLMTTLLGIPAGWGRSAKIVMQYVNPEHVLRHVAGVMNTFYIGEAYANWGSFGLIWSTVYVGALYSLVQNIFLGAKKTAIHLTMYLIFIWCFTLAYIGGFVDFIYNANLIIMVMLYIVLQSVNKVQKMRLKPIGGKQWIKD